MEIIRFFIIILLIALFIMVYVSVIDKGYSVIIAFIFLGVSMLVSPILVLLLTVHFLPDNSKKQDG